MGTLSKIVAIDYRSLRLFRVLLGVGLILEALFLFPALHEFFSDDGLLTRQMIFSWSLLNFSGAAWWPALWLLILIGAGIFLLLDHYPRAASLVAFIGINAFLRRASPIFYGSDWLLQVLCLWSLLLPAGRPDGDDAETFSSGVSASLLAQLALLYLVSGFAKAKGPWWDDPVAGYHAFGDHSYGGAFGRYLQTFPKLLEWSTRSVWVIERSAWILFFIPWRNGILRFFGVLIFACLQLSFHFFLNLQLFPYMNLVLLAVALPPAFWRAFTPPSFLNVKSVNERKGSPGTLWSAVSEPTAMVYIALMIWLSIHFIPGRSVKMPKFIERGVIALGLEQNWVLFAPAPPAEDGWFVFVGHLGNGRVVDLFARRELQMRFGYTGDPLAEPPNFWWRNYLYAMRGNPSPIASTRLSEYLCKNFRGFQGQPFTQVDSYYIHHPLAKPGHARPVYTELKYSLVCPRL